MPVSSLIMSNISAAIGTDCFVSTCASAACYRKISSTVFNEFGIRRRTGIPVLYDLQARPTIMDIGESSYRQNHTLPAPPLERTAGQA
jgi:hypothetical protein